MYVITTRSGKILESDFNVEKSSDVRIALKVEDESSREGAVLERSAGKNERGEKDKEKEPEKESTKDQTPLPLNLQPRNVRLPFPQRFARSRLNVQFGKFLDVVKSLHVSKPFVDSMKEMPHYSKFVKDLLNGRREVETVSLTANCSDILFSKLPTKLQDPGSFSIPCSINEIHLGKALCDLGASVSLMPFSVYQKLNVGNLSPTNITLQLADRSAKLPIGKVEDIPLRVGKFTFLVDFYVLEMDEDEIIPIILGRPFLATSKAIIDVKEGKMTLKVDNGSIEFDLNKVMRQPSSSNEFFRIDTIENLMNEFRYPHMHASNDLLENVLLNENEVGDQKEMQLYEEMLDEKEETTPEQEMLQTYEVFQVEEEEISNGKGAPKVELKPLPSGLRYVFLDANDTFSIIDNANLREEKTSSLLNVLKKHRKALGYTLDDLKEVVRKEVSKLLEAGIIYPIAHSDWVSPVQVVPKKGGMTEKCHFMVENGIVLGHKISQAGIEVDGAKVDVIENLPPPTNVREVRLKKALCTAPIVQGPDWSLPFELMCDASDDAIGLVLGQRKDGKLHVIYYLSKTLNDAQRNYTTTEKEFLAVIHLFEKFITYLIGSRTIVYTDHSALKIFNKQEGGQTKVVEMGLGPSRL
ncbi:uncharacterized protein LOC110717298 [Chenopodium quinoa]|uniref:uncharacterized protein LOC110717298 n=1 Tax=Chenopodium quinoa TaxID=63459 RepID=UPI000B76F43F|nr:uncharacterized protein LOC110717298 [Chenopodium quinoa]